MRQGQVAPISSQRNCVAWQKGRRRRHSHGRDCEPSYKAVKDSLKGLTYWHCAHDDDDERMHVMFSFKRVVRNSRVRPMCDVSQRELFALVTVFQICAAETWPEQAGARGKTRPGYVSRHVAWGMGGLDRVCMQQGEPMCKQLQLHAGRASWHAPSTHMTSVRKRLRA